MTGVITPSEMGAHCEQAAKSLTLERWFLNQTIGASSGEYRKQKYFAGGSIETHISTRDQGRFWTVRLIVRPTFMGSSCMEGPNL